MTSSICSSRESRSTRTSLAVFNAHPPTPNRDSKVQHILGISRSELDHARFESLKPASSATSTASSILYDTVSASNSSISDRLARLRGKVIGVSISNSKFDSGPIQPSRECGDQNSEIITESQSPSLKRFSSTSTLRSVYDSAGSPVTSSQQPSNSSSLDLVLRKDQPTAGNAETSDMDCTQYPFFKSSKSRKLDEKKNPNRGTPELGSQTMYMTTSRRSSFVSPKTKSPQVNKVSLTSPTSRPTTPSARNARETGTPDQPRPRATLRKKRSIQPKIVEIIHPDFPSFYDPCMKIHTRRPKAGTREWFDDLEGVSSDDEYQDLEPKPMSSEVKVDRETEITTTSTPKSPRHRRKVSRDRKSLSVTINEEPELLVRPISPIFYKPVGSRPVSKKSPSKSFTESIRKHDPLVKADLSQESVLSLSTSDGEHEDDDILPEMQQVQSIASGPPIRKSVVEGMNDDSDIEIGLAHAVKATGRTPGKRPAPIRIVSDGELEALSHSPTTPSPWRPAPKSGSLNSSSMLSESLDMKDMDEDMLLSSFPATPIDANRPRSSISISDDRSVVSMRLMKVTKQEENLIAAMRLKRSAMKRAEKSAARKQPVSVPDEKVHVPERRSSLIETPRSSVDVSRPVTAFVPDSHGRTSGEIPLLVEFRDKSHSRDSSFSYTKRKSPGTSHGSYGPFPRLSSNFSPASSAGFQGRDSNVIVLDNLNSELSRQNFPSHFYIESPFSTWGKSGSPIVQ